MDDAARRPSGVPSGPARFAAPGGYDVTHILHRQLRNALPVAVSARGITITDAEGKPYIDGSAGAAVSCLGHGHPDVIAAMHAQIDRLAYAHTSFFTTEVAEALADHLIAHAPA